MNGSFDSSTIFDSVFAHAELGVAVLDLQGDVVRANQTLADFLQRSPDELIGSSFNRFMRNGDREIDRSLFSALADGHRDTYRLEARFLRPDGGGCWGVATYSIVRLADGGPESVVVMVNDITEDRELRDLEQRNQSAVQRAYAEVVAAITDGTLLILSEEELPDQLGHRIAGPFDFHDEHGPGEIRHAIRERALEYQPGVAWDQGFEVAVGEALLNALEHAGGGTASLYALGDLYQAVVSDRGTGIDFTAITRVAAAMEDVHLVEHTVGIGFTLILSFTKRVLLATGVNGTTLVLEGGVGDARSERRSSSGGTDSSA